jgi:hypothetical protein
MNLRLAAAAAAFAVTTGTQASAHHSVEGAFEPVVDTYPARDGTKNFAFILRVTYPDGHSYQLYNNPDATR